MSPLSETAKNTRGFWTTRIAGGFWVRFVMSISKCRVREIKKENGARGGAVGEPTNVRCCTSGLCGGAAQKRFRHRRSDSVSLWTD